jgi:hypothetical protein
MLNPATRAQNELNEFTMVIANAGGQAKVRLRSGEVVQPEWFPAADPTCEDCFLTDDKRWNPDGTSVTRSVYDMMEIVR